MPSASWLPREVSRRRLSGLETAPENWQHAQNRPADWLQTLPPQTGIIAVTDARARHVLQVCEHLHIPVPEKLCVIGIDNEELTRYLSRVALSSVAQGTRQMGYQAAKLLHRLLANESLPLQRLLVPPVRVVERRSTDYRSLNDPAVIQAMHYIRNHACKGIKVDQVLDSVGISRSNLEKRFKEEVGETIHAVIHAEKLEKARSLLISTSLSINEISQMCGYPSLQYFYSVFRKSMTPRRRSTGNGTVKSCSRKERLPVEGVFITYVRQSDAGYLVHGEQVIVITLSLSGITFQLVDHRRSRYFLIRLTQLSA